jgi:hypothetical protein
MKKLIARIKASRIERHRLYFAAVLPPTPPPVVFEFAGLYQQLSEINNHLAELVAIEQRRERQRSA